MLRYQALVTCYADPAGVGKLRLFEVDDVVELEKPLNPELKLDKKFLCLDEIPEDAEIDFATASEEVLMAVKLNFKAMQDYAKEHMNHDLVKGDKRKPEIVQEFLKIRNETANPAVNPHTS